MYPTFKETQIVTGITNIIGIHITIITIKVHILRSIFGIFD